jgi:hypothetical protein
MLGILVSTNSTFSSTDAIGLNAEAAISRAGIVVIVGISKARSRWHR